MSFRNNFFLAMLSLLCSVPGLALETLDDGLVAHYSFEGNAEDRLGQHHGELRGDPEFVQSPYGSGVYFDGAGDYIEVTDSPLFSPGTNDYSISAWFRFPSEFEPQHPGQFKNQIFMIQQSPESFRWVQLAGWGLSGDLERTIEFGLKSGTNASQTVVQVNRSSVWDDEWHHVAGVRRGVHTLELYVDGRLETVITNPLLSSVETSSSTPMYIGYDPGYGGFPMVGAVDELRIYQRALSAEEVVGLATPAAAGPACLCTVETFDGDDISAWTLAGVGNANQEEIEVVIGGDEGWLELTADGATAYYGADNAGFFYREITGNFRIESDVDATEMIAGKPWAKTGLMVRASLDHWDIRLLAMLVPDQQLLQFAARDAYGAPGNVKVGLEVEGAPDTVRLAILRTGQLLSVEYSLDGGVSWTVPPTGLGGAIEVANLPETVLVGLGMVSNNISVTSKARFDNVAICR